VTDEDPWYVQLREEWKPARVRLLLIAESAPDDDGDPARRRYFYSDRLTRDNLFRAVVDALYRTTREDLLGYGKRASLEQLRTDGVYLIDLSTAPVNRLVGPARTRALRESVPGCVARAIALQPEGIVLVKHEVHAMLAQPLRDAGLKVLNDAGLPFPLGNWRAQFVEGVRAAVGRLESRGR
jgi:hypothetical protein